MYKTISIRNDTYQQLNAVATRLQKPKAQVIDAVVADLVESMKENDTDTLRVFNARMKERIKRITMPKGTKVNTDDLDSWFSALKDKAF